MKNLPRCKDLFGYCAKQRRKPGHDAHYLDGTVAFPTIRACPENHLQCKHYRTLTQTLKPKRARSRTHTSPIPSH